MSALPSCVVLFCLSLSACLRGVPAQEPTAPVAPAAAAVAAIGPLGFPLPARWTVVQQAEHAAVLNPGYAADEVLAAVVVVAALPLAADQRRLAPAALLRAHLPSLRDELAQEQVAIDLRSVKVQGLAAAAGGGAAVDVPGLAGGERPVQVWAGLRPCGEHAAVVVVVRQRGSGAEPLAAAVRLLAAAAPLPAPAGPAAGGGPAGADDLAGLEFGRESFGSDASLTTVYRFGRGGALQRRTMFSSPFGGSDREANGRYTRRGDRLELHVDGEVEVAAVERQGGRIVALRLGGATYRRL